MGEANLSQNTVILSETHEVSRSRRTRSELGPRPRKARTSPWSTTSQTVYSVGAFQKDFPEAF